MCRLPYNLVYYFKQYKLFGENIVMKKSASLIIVLSFFMILTSTLNAQEIIQVLEDRDTMIKTSEIGNTDLQNDNLSKKDVEKKHYSYLLLSPGYYNIFEDGKHAHGGAGYLTYGFQSIKNPLAMEIDFGVRISNREYDEIDHHFNDHFTNIDLRYKALLSFQIKLNESWTIIPKIGVGVFTTLAGLSSDVTGTKINENINLGYEIGVGVLATVGVRAIYKKFIFGVSGEIDFGLAPFDAVGAFIYSTSFRLLAEVGVKF